MYKTLSSYLKERYGMKIKKICIDGGFSCPNRDGRCGTGGCIYCGERGAGEHIEYTESITEQVRRGLATVKADGFIAYFQNFTNTYADIETLKQRYDAALIDERIKVLAIGTRPDCINEEVARLIASYKDTVDVWVELGLQSASDKVARAINRGYETSVYITATRLLRKYGIPFVTHMIIGLPEDDREGVLGTVDLINECGSWGVKIHSIYVMEGTALAEMYRQNRYTPPTFEEYVALAIDALERLSPDVIVHRVTGDCPGELLIAPEWNREKNAVISAIRKGLEERIGK